MPQLIQPQTIEQTFTRFGFTRRAHNADKLGEYATNWKGLITLSSENPDIDEIEAARDFESMVITGAIPMHGVGWRLASINFNFNPTASDRAELGDHVTCIVTVGYRSEVKRLPFDEAVERMQAMGVNVERLNPPE